MNTTPEQILAHLAVMRQDEHAETWTRPVDDWLSPFRVRVGYSTNDELQAHRTEIGFADVEVLAGDATEAELVAAQMVACRGVMPTSTAPG